MSDHDEIAKVLAAHHGCEIMFTERGAETCTGGMLPRGSYESIAHAYRLHLSAVLAERERRVKAEAWDQGWRMGRGRGPGHTDACPVGGGRRDNPYCADRIEGQP